MGGVRQQRCLRIGNQIEGLQVEDRSVDEGERLKRSAIRFKAARGLPGRGPPGGAARKSRVGRGVWTFHASYSDGMEIMVEGGGVQTGGTSSRAVSLGSAWHGLYRPAEPGNETRYRRQSEHGPVSVSFPLAETLFFDGQEWHLGRNFNKMVSFGGVESAPPKEACGFKFTVEERNLLCEAVAAGSASDVERLLSENVSPDQRNRNGEPALVIAAKAGHVDVLQTLVRAGASLEATDEHGTTALVYSAFKGKLACVEALLDRGADVNAVTKKGDTALHAAVMSGDERVVRLLAVLHLMDRGKRNNAGETALEVAQKKGKANIAAALLQLDAVAIEAAAQTLRAALASEPMNQTVAWLRRMQSAIAEAEAAKVDRAELEAAKQRCADVTRGALAEVVGRGSLLSLLRTGAEEAEEELQTLTSVGTAFGLPLMTDDPVLLAARSLLEDVSTLRQICSEQSNLRLLQNMTSAGLLEGIAQGLTYLQSRCVDLSALSQVAAEEILKVCRQCPDLEALFLPICFELSPSTHAEVRKICPKIRCLALGREIGVDTYSSLVKQYAAGDAELGGLLPVVIPEGAPSARPARDMEPEPEPAPELHGEAAFHSLDLSGKEFAELTDAGLGEIMDFCADINAVFLAPDTKVTAEGLKMVRTRCPGIRCTSLSREVSRVALLQMLRQYKQAQRINLCDASLYKHLSDDGIGDIASLCPNINDLFVSPDTNPKLTTCGLQKLRGACAQSARCIALGHEISESAFDVLLTGYNEVQTLDLSTPEFLQLTDAGLEEISALVCAKKDLRALFLTPQLRQRLDGKTLDELQALSPSAQFVTVADEISMPARTHAIEAEAKLDSLQEESTHCCCVRSRCTRSS